MKPSLIWIGLALTYPNLSMAQESNWYVGAGVNHTGKMDSDLSDSSMGGQINVGYEFHPNWAIEASTGYYGNLDMVIPGDYRNTIEEETRYGSDISLLGALSLSQYYNLYGGLGAQVESGDISPIGQLGIQYEYSPSWSIKFGYKFLWASKSEYNLQMLGLGLQYHFARPETDVEQEPSYDDISVIASTKVPTSTPEKTATKTRCTTNTYIVKKGDWLIKIAYQHNLSFSELKAINNDFREIKDLNLIYPNQEVLVPSAGSICP
ncbi:outer membrane beta-barrel protein [Vibrio campbellii]|uniref:LysM peptidoglycan-binding domain-containing protein n=1 Tax=Vibrio campbellii TaxID=680 RepID=UPI0009BF79D2|nr:outer membrane beta-barrel protein [Vibrio campbellii]OQQ03899.1 hypothetical protein BK412_09705 [Vibrio campbellii]